MLSVGKAVHHLADVVGSPEDVFMRVVGIVHTEAASCGGHELHETLRPGGRGCAMIHSRFDEHHGLDEFRRDTVHPSSLQDDVVEAVEVLLEEHRIDLRPVGWTSIEAFQEDGEALVSFGCIGEGQHPLAVGAHVDVAGTGQR